MTCDTTPAGKTIAFSHKYFRQDKPDLVQLIQITKEKDIGEATRERREALRAALPSMTSPPSALRLPGATSGPLREEGLRATQDATVGLLTSGSPSLPRPQQPSLANLVAAEHNQNLSAQGPDSLLQSLTSEWHRTNQDATLGAQLQTGRVLPGLSGGLRSAENADLLARMAIRGAGREQLEQMRPSVRDGQRMHRLESLLQAEGGSLESTLHSAAFQHQRREALLQQHLGTSGLGSHVDAHSRFFLQQQLAGRSLSGGTQTQATTGSSIYHAPASALLSHSHVNSQLSAQVPGLQQGGSWSIEQLLARRNMSAIQQQSSGHARDGARRSTHLDGGMLTADELRYLAELRRRGS